MQEGSIWEGLLFAAHHKLSNLYIILDNNKKQSSGLVKEILNLEPINKKYLLLILKLSLAMATI